MSAVRRGGFVSVLGVYSSPFDNFPIHQFFDKGITLRGGQAPAHKYIDKLMGHIANDDVRLDDIISHRLPLSQAPHACDIFRNKKDNCTKVVLKPGEQRRCCVIETASKETCRAQVSFFVGGTLVLKQAAGFALSLGRSGSSGVSCLEKLRA